MALKPQLARIMGAAAVLAALVLAPSAASAHAGHAHPPAATQTAAAPADAQDTDAARVAAPNAEVAAAPARPPMPSDNVTCGGLGCCSNAPCSGCHGGVLASVPATTPPMLGASLIPVDAPPGSSPHDGRLRRPPKSFA